MTTPTSSSQSAPLTPSAPILGRFIWHELLTLDVAAAQRFYSAVLDWGVQRWEGPMDYTMWTVGDVPTGGYFPLPEEARQQGAPPHWMTYVGVPDVDASVAQATSLGATICMEPHDIPEVGRFAVLFDPQGAEIAVYTPIGGAGPETPPSVGQPSWHELATKDSPAAMRFYTQLFGWSQTNEIDMGGGMIYRLFGRNGQDLGGMFDITPEMGGMPPSWCPYFRVADVNAAVARITANGGTIVNGPMEVPGGDMIAQGLDPQGAYFAVHQVSAAHQAP